MRQEPLYLIALVVIAVLASIPQIPVDAQIWAALLAIIGIVCGVLVNFGDITGRTVIYVVALALPTIDNCLTPIWVIGPWLGMLFDHIATGVQGVALGLFVMALIARVQGKSPAAAS